TRRLFGSSPAHPPTSTSVSPEQPISTTNVSDLGVSPAPSTTTLGDGEDSKFSQFDLSRVFSALQVMKEGISEITDSERRAATRVALGLVYGLQRDEDADVQYCGEGRGRG